MLKTEIVYAWESALLYMDGAFQRQLRPGRHLIFTPFRKAEVFRLPNHPTVFPGGPVDVISSDRFALRLGATVVAQISDPRAAIEGQSRYASTLSLAVAEALVAAATERSLDDLITGRAELGQVIADRVRGKVPELDIQSAVVATFVPPPEIRRMLTEVERAKHEGAAALERARGEHAALRSLANAARLLKDNPELMRLRTLQAASPTGKGATLVLGQDAIAAPRPEA